MWFAFAIQLIMVLLIFQPDKSLSCDQADWSVSLDRATWSKCPSTNTYLTGLYRNDRHPGDERVGRIEYGRCCEATEPSYTNQPSTCSNADWLHTLDGFHVWALCPTGYYLSGLRLGAGPPAYLLHIDEGQCCHPQGHPNSYEDCYDEDVTHSFDHKGWSECQRAGYFMTGFYKSSCNDIYCIETFRCCKMKKPVINGGWSAYGDWSECSVTCGAGQQERFRTCTNPPPSNGGAQCPGSNKETRPCDSGTCEVDGGWSNFGDWSECSVACGGGITMRRRNCTNPPPSNGGACCVGDNLEAKCCNTDSCVVNGGWSDWSAYGECSKTCGKGRKFRYRTCTNPPPSENGKKCKGKSRQSKKCKVMPCTGW